MFASHQPAIIAYSRTHAHLLPYGCGAQTQLRVSNRLGQGIVHMCSVWVCLSLFRLKMTTMGVHISKPLVSNAMGVASLISWSFCELPQILHNHQHQVQGASVLVCASALSELAGWLRPCYHVAQGSSGYLLLTWAIGDVLNLSGVVLLRLVSRSTLRQLSFPCARRATQAVTRWCLLQLPMQLWIGTLYLLVTLVLCGQHAYFNRRVWIDKLTCGSADEAQHLCS